MRSLVLTAIAALPLAATPAFGQPASAGMALSMTRDAAQLPLGSSKFSLRADDVVGDDGSRRKRRSIIAGVTVAPDTMLGFGLFDSLPKARGRGPDARLDGLAKRSRRAAVGMSFRF